MIACGLLPLSPGDFMSDLDVQIPTAFDPFAEANAGDAGAAAGSKDYVHVRIQQRNGRKSLTTVQGLKKEFSYSKILKDLKKEFCCNGTVVQDTELGQVIQLQGDQRKNVSNFLVQPPQHGGPVQKAAGDSGRGSGEGGRPQDQLDDMARSLAQKAKVAPLKKQKAGGGDGRIVRA
uniref:Protein translation factor SUI1 homolog n=1 Tax=Aegilops tauschii TaxID=37682 RepID=R7WF35_AEGTA